MGKSNIEWTEHVWNPVWGCTRISPGCENCYAERDAAKKNENPTLPKYHDFAIFQPQGPRWTGRVELIEHRLGTLMGIVIQNLKSTDIGRAVVYRSKGGVKAEDGVISSWNVENRWVFVRYQSPTGGSYVAATDPADLKWR